jgi:hypothetical protein
MEVHTRGEEMNLVSVDLGKLQHVFQCPRRLSMEANSLLLLLEKVIPFSLRMMGYAMQWD